MKTKSLLQIVFALVLTCSASAQPLPPGRVLFGKSIGEWSADWVKWIYATCTNENPLLDRDGRWAYIGQTSVPVFLVGGTFQFSGTVERTFTVPENRYLFFPLFNGWVDNIGNDPPWTVEMLRDFERVNIDGVEKLEADLDGSAIADLFSYRAISPVFSLEFPDPCNLVTLISQPFTGLDDTIVADGYYLMLQPLPLGEHLLVFGGSRGAPDFMTRTTVHLTVSAVPLTQWVDEFINVVQTISLSDREQRTFLLDLQNARRAFARGSLHAGINHMRAFERSVSRDTGFNADLAGDFVSYAERIIVRAKRELPD